MKFTDEVVLTIGFIAAILKLLLLPAAAVYLIWFL